MAKSESALSTVGKKSLALCFLASQLTRAANGLCLGTSTFFRWLFVGATFFHFAENAFALHLFLQGAQRLVNVVIANDYLHG